MKPLALLVEDRPEVAKIWGMCLEPLNVEVIHVTTLVEAFAMLTKIPPPDLVLLDLNLGIDSPAEFTVTQIEKMKQFNPNLVVIVISGLLTPDITALAATAGAHAIREKLDMSRQVDMWNAIEESLAKAPAKARNIFEHPLRILETLTHKLHLI